MRLTKQTLRFLILSSVIFFLGCILLHKASSSHGLKYEDVAYFASAQPTTQDKKTFAYPDVQREGPITQREDSRTFPRPNKRKEGSETVPSANVQKESSKISAVPYMQREDSGTIAPPNMRTEGSETVPSANVQKESSKISAAPYMQREDSGTIAPPNMRTEGSETVPSANAQKESSTISAAPYMQRGDSRTFASPYMFPYKEFLWCLNNTPTATAGNPQKSGAKLILYWQHHVVFPVTQRFRSLCQRQLLRPCEITFNERLHGRADAIIFHASRLKAPRPPFKKRPGQIWIARGLESPIHWSFGYKSPGWRRQFNWTMTYRPDSELFQPVGTLMEVPEPERPGKDFKKIADSKTKSVAWFVSDCNTLSRREDYVRQLKKYIDVHIYGSCGNLKCPKYEQECYDMLSRKYRFYLSFENSICPHYVTEKFFNKFGHNVDIVPVVRGGADYRKYFPEGTFINTADFKSPKELATFLRSLGADTDAYAAMLERKSRYRAIHCAKKDTWCKLCDMLHDDNRPSNLYEDLAAWWEQESCLDKKDVKDIETQITP